MEKKNTKTFNPIGKWDDISEAQNLRENINKAIKITGVKVNIGDLMDKLHMLVVDYNRKYMEIIDYIKQYWGKYLNMKFYNKNCDYEINIVPYQYIPSNGCLFGIIGVLNSNYKGGLEDTSLDIQNLVETHKLEITEITKEQFYLDVAKRTANCLKHRMDKIYSDDYELDQNGYKYKNY